MRFLDIHTHRREAPPDKDAIVNLHTDFENAATDGFYSAGLHPWYLHKETLEADLSALRNAACNPQIIAIGECGLDSRSATDFSLQIEAFKQHLDLAKALQKPLIIHCVRAFDETLKLLKDFQVGVPVIFHGYRKSLDLAKRILSAGHYLSFGQALVIADYQKRILPHFPTNRLFLETDQSNLPIQTLYTAAADGLNMTLERLCHSIERNAAAVFGEKFCPHE